MKLRIIKSLWGESTYLSEILEAENLNGKRYIIKRNRGKLTKEQYRCLQWLTEIKPKEFLIPLEFKGNIGERWEEIYDFVDWPTLEDILHGSFHIDSDSKKGFEFSHAVKIIEQLTCALGSLHSQDFIHHDVRAKNLFVNPKGLEIKLFDYNSIREPYFLDRGIDSWNDIPPECRVGNCVIDFRFDVYQTGKLFFEMINKCNKNYNEVKSDIQCTIIELMEKASHKQKEQRYFDCNEFYGAIASLESLEI